VHSIYVRARGWGIGAGRALMQQGLAELRARGFEEATLWVLDTNDRARRFYDAGGWRADISKTDEIGGATVIEVRYRLSL
jgi:ribosomal protein S18 acetylase RimI-like enzyme